MPTVVLLAGEDNRCFLPESQERTFDYFDTQGQGRYALHIVPALRSSRHVHGQRCRRDVFPIIRDALRDELRQLGVSDPWAHAGAY